MQSAIIDTNRSTAKSLKQRLSVVPEFSYQNGYTLSIADLGKAGVKIEVGGTFEDSAAVILPPDKTKECRKWLGRTLGQRDLELPPELANILRRLLKSKNPRQVLVRGDKKIVKEALKQLELKHVQKN